MMHELLDNRSYIVSWTSRVVSFMGANNQPQFFSRIKPAKYYWTPLWRNFTSRKFFRRSHGVDICWPTRWSPGNLFLPSKVRSCGHSNMTPDINAVSASSWSGTFFWHATPSKCSLILVIDLRVVIGKYVIASENKVLGLWKTEER